MEIISVTWTAERKEKFVSLLLSFINKDKSSYYKHGFTKVWAAIEKKWFEETGLAYTKAQLQNQLSDLKKRYNIFKQLKENSAFGWDDKLNIPTASDKTWDEFLAANKFAKEFRNKTLPNYEELCIIFDGKVSAGKNTTADEQSTDPVETSNEAEEKREDKPKALGAHFRWTEPYALELLRCVKKHRAYIRDTQHGAMLLSDKWTAVLNELKSNPMFVNLDCVAYTVQCAYLRVRDKVFDPASKDSLPKEMVDLVMEMEKEIKDAKAARERKRKHKTNTEVVEQQASTSPEKASSNNDTASPRISSTAWSRFSVNPVTMNYSTIPLSSRAGASSYPLDVDSDNSNDNAEALATSNIDALTKIAKKRKLEVGPFENAKLELEKERLALVKEQISHERFKMAYEAEKMAYEKEKWALEREQMNLERQKLAMEKEKMSKSSSSSSGAHKK